jgi:hypothetical protein
MERIDLFEDFDDPLVYDRARKSALQERTRNFAVEFGKENARIAFNLGEEELRDFVVAEAQPTAPVKWM